MRHPVKAILGGAAAIAIAANPASAQSRYWEQLCGSALRTCASVYVEVTGNSVALRVWNLAGVPSLAAGTLAGWQNFRITEIGFYGPGTSGITSITPSPSPTTSGTSYGTPSEWVILKDSKVQGTGGGAPGNILARVDAEGSPNSAGIISNCNPSNRPGTGGWISNPGCNVPGSTSSTGWVQISFTFTGTWDLNATELAFHAQGGPGGQSTACWTATTDKYGNVTGPGNCDVVPEPITVVLLGSGLAGMGGVGFLRRRREGRKAGT